MPKGLKETSSLITIGFTATEPAPNTFVEARVDLQLNPLDNEVFVVQAVNLNVTRPDGLAGIDTATSGALTSTSQAALALVPDLSNSNVIARLDETITSAGYVDNGVGFVNQSMETPPTGLEYIAIISTNDFFVQCQGFQNSGNKRVTGKMYGYRARADSSVYAALVQSELLSA